jgi:phage terminase large subunit GpA-like protein
MWAAQCAKTEAILNFILWVTKNDPGPMLFIQSTEKIMETTSIDRIQPMIDMTPSLKKLYRGKNSKVLFKNFVGCSLDLAGANSSSALASFSRRYVLKDEVDKWPQFTGREASPIKLADQRTSNYEQIRKIVNACTPTTENGAIATMIKDSDIFIKYFVPCPICGEFQTLVTDLLKWPKDCRDANSIKKNVYYECVACHGEIEPSQKLDMLAKGEWRPIYNDEHPDLGLWPIPPGTRVSVGSQIGKLYSPWVSWGKYAANFMDAKDDPAKLMDFRNSDEGLPWVERIQGGKKELVLKRKAKYERETIPEKAIMLLAGIDVQLAGFYVELRAFAPRTRESWLVYNCFVTSWEELSELLFHNSFKYGDEYMHVMATAIDSGYRTHEVYEFSRFNSNVWPVKGDNRPTSGIPFRRSIIDSYPSGEKIPGGVTLLRVNGDHYKTELWERIQSTPESNRGWWIFEDVEDDYINQICSEHQERKRPRDKASYLVWKKKYESIKNHYLDTTVYVLALSQFLGLERMHAETKPYTVARLAEKKASAPAKPIPTAPQGQGFVGKTGRARPNRRNGFVNRRRH